MFDVLNPLFYDGLQRKDYEDHQPRNWNEVALAGYKYCSLKYDGIWCRLVITGGRKYYFSRNNQLKKECALTNEELHHFSIKTYVFLGEFMYGQQWCVDTEREGRLYIFDCLVLDGQDISNYCFSDRMKNAERVVPGKLEDCELVRYFNVDKAPYVWDARVDNGLSFKESFEGLCFVKPGQNYATDILGRMKKELEDDFVITGFEPGEGKHLGRLGALTLGGYRNGTLLTLFRCGGGLSDEQRQEFWDNQARYMGKVVKVYAKARFDSGALRSPQFRCMHPDKSPSDVLV